MELTVITESKSRGISDGLTYTASEHIELGQLVEVPLRGKATVGIVVKSSEKQSQAKYQIKPINKVLSNAPVLSAAHIKTALWMADHYATSVRTALQVFLGAPPWKKLPTVATSTPATAKKKPLLLIGGTHDARTKTCIATAKDVLANGQSVIVVVPQILDAHRAAEAYRADCGDRVIEMSESTKRKNWEKIAGSDTCIVIGTRSALFAPAKNLGLIVIDDEHDVNHKNRQAPKYHSRLTAEVLASYCGAQLVMSSPAPTLESWHHAETGRFAKQVLPLPSTRVLAVDLADTGIGASYPLSATLIAAIDARLKRSERSVLLINKRGGASGTLCLDCRKQHTEFPALCPQCGSARLLEIGAGTQKVQSLLKKLFPKANILRADKDVQDDGESIAEVIEEFTKGSADILVGTAPVLRAIGLPKVTLAAAVVADIGLSQPDFRSGERIVQTLCTLVDRSGGSKDHEVIIQTFRPQSPEMLAAVSGNFNTYYAAELASRKTVNYPPFTQMIRLTPKGATAERKAEELAKQINNPPELAAIASPLPRGGWQVMVRGKEARKVLTNVDLEGVVVDVDTVE